jgi:hypothetical protein
MRSGAGAIMGTHYNSVNEMFDGRTLPPITREHSIKIANRIYRHFGNKKYASNPARFRRPKSVTGSRSWIDKKGINDLNKGWRRLIHDTSHILFSRRYPQKRPHDPLHAALELQVAQFVVREFIEKPALQAAGAALGAIFTETKSETVKRQRAVRYGRILERIDNWEKKKKRAETALKKLYKQKKYYPKVIQ